MSENNKTQPNFRCQLCGKVSSWDEVMGTLRLSRLGNEPRENRPLLFWECPSEACQEEKRMPGFGYVELLSEVVDT